MKLKRLIIHGFKSFKDRTIINFDDGITGIVGPNGCGKSNVVDALFWVMGEQSAKHLRGNSMQDLIFSGSSRYSPASFAEVSLVLENEEGKHIHIGNSVAAPTEICLTRKLYRNGETEYRINDFPCRLKDIQEVFMDTGAGAKSYSIIAQGEINRLVQAKPEERRTMIEEVAGITKFKMRKRESLRKIEQTEENLGRLTDLKTEIEKNLSNLQKQAEKAERARTLKDKIRRYELVVDSHKEFEALKEIRDIQTLLTTKKIEVETDRTKKSEIELSLEEERLNKDVMTSRTDEMQQEYNVHSRELAASEERYKSLARIIKDKEEQILRSEKEIKEIEIEITNRKERENKLTQEREDLARFEQEDHDLSPLEERVENLREEMNLKENAKNEVESTLRKQREELLKIEQEIFRNSSKLEEYSATLQDTTAEIEALEKQYSGVSSEVVAEREAVNNLEQKVSEEKALVDSEKAQVEKLSAEDRELEAQFKIKQRELIVGESKLDSLIQISASLDGVNAGTKEFLNSEAGKDFKILAPNIKCDVKYTGAVQRLLSEYMDMLLANEGSATAPLSYVKNGGTGLDLLLLGNSGEISEESIERLKLNGLDDVITLGSVVEIPQGLEGLKSLFNGLYISELLSEDHLLTLPKGLNFKAIAHLNGKILIKNGGDGRVLSVKAEGELVGAVERNNKIADLKLKVAELSAEVSTLEAKKKEVSEALSNTKTRYEEVRVKHMELTTSYVTKKANLESKLKGFESTNTRVEILKKRKSEVSKSRLEYLEKEESISLKREELGKAVDELEIKLSNISEELSIVKSSFEEGRERLLEKQVELKSFSDRVKSIESQLEDVLHQIERQNQKLSSSKEHTQHLVAEVETSKSEEETLKSINQEKALVLSEKEDLLSIVKEQLAELLLGMQTRENQVRELGKRISDAEKKMVESEIKIGQLCSEEEQIVRNIFEKYQIDLRHTLTRFLEMKEEEQISLHNISGIYFMETENGPVEIRREPFEFIRRYGQDLKDVTFDLKNFKTEFSRLGDINWQAIEDYDRQKARFDFLKVQEQELKTSLEDLQKAIAHIDEKSRERFKLAFEEVNSRFEKVFPIIFGGGNAKLVVTGDLDDPECGVDIIAQPPGKKMQNINLMSGGEKALTAVSLIFSIFLVKPSPFCLLDEVDAPLDDANVGRFNELLREMSADSQFILITHNKKTMELNDMLYGVTMQEPGVSKAVSVQLQ